MRAGFSLVELSIVLVILGLLTGGILTGQNLIRAAELRSVITEHQELVTAVYTFKDRYFALPGDMPNATQIWGAASGTSVTGCVGSARDPATNEGIGTQTCNGNNDGIFNNENQPYGGEIWTFWEHLANAGLIEGSFNGVHGPNSTIHAVIGQNVPASKFSGAGWGVYHRTPAFSGHANIFDDQGVNILFWGYPITDNRIGAFTLTAEELWNIDTKMDDGKPARGKIRSYHHTNDCTDAANSADLDADYDLDTSDVECAVAFPNFESFF